MSMGWVPLTISSGRGDCGEHSFPQMPFIVKWTDHAYMSCLY